MFTRRFQTGAMHLKILIAILVFASLLHGKFAFAGDCENPHDPRYVYAAKVVRIYDGDTIYMDIDLGFRMWLHGEPLRLWGIDTPEVKGQTKIVGLAVRDLVAEWIPEGSDTIIRTLKDKNGEDRTGSFHRYLAIVCPLGWSESINARLLREGHATISAGSEKDRRAFEATFLTYSLEQNYSTAK